MKKQVNEFPITKTKTRGVKKEFNLNTPGGRREYFNQKAGKEIALLKNYFKKNSFIAYFLGKKNSGKGTYTKMMIEIFGKNKIGHISAGDIIRAAHRDILDRNRKKELMDYLKNNYRGYISLEEAIDSLIGRKTSALIPTEFTLALIKREIEKMPRKTLFIDGFPRELDQISYSLFFRDLINFRSDLDIFIAIDIPESVIEARMQGRVVCPVCQVPRGLRLLPTKEIGYDERKKEFYCICDNSDCKGARMVGKEGDNLGLKPFRKRLDTDGQLVDKVFNLHGVPKVFLRNSVPVNLAKKYVDDYEITPQFNYQWDKKNRKVEATKEPWIIKDDNGERVHSLLAAPVALSLIKQLTKVLGLKK